MLSIWPNGWTHWAEICCGHSWVVGGSYRLKKNLEYFFQNIFFFKSIFSNFVSRATPGPSAVMCLFSLAFITENFVSRQSWVPSNKILQKYRCIQRFSDRHEILIRCLFLNHAIHPKVPLVIFNISEELDYILLQWLYLNQRRVYKNHSR